MTRKNLQSEAQISRLISRRFSNGAVRLFRNNVGICQYPDGSKVTYGLCPGSSDKIGWKSVTITDDMVGTKIAQFVAIEEKSASGRPTKQQVNFIQAVRDAGGRAGIAKSERDAELILYS